MGKVTLGRQLIDTGPCTDGQQANMGEIANLLEQLGLPGPPLEGPKDPDTGLPVDGGDTYDNVYVDDNDILYKPAPVPGDPPIIVLTGGGGVYSAGIGIDAVKLATGVIEVDYGCGLKENPETANELIIDASQLAGPGLKPSEEVGSGLCDIQVNPVDPLFTDHNSQPDRDKLELFFDGETSSSPRLTWTVNQDLGTLEILDNGTGDKILYANWEQILTNVTNFSDVANAKQIITNRGGTIQWEDLGAC